MEDDKFKIERFDGKDFGYWKMQMEDYLYQRNLYQPLDGERPRVMNEEDWAILDRRALGAIRLSLARCVAFNVKDETTTAGLMKALTDMYEKPSALNKVYLMRRLFDLKLFDGDSVMKHINEFNSICSQLSSVDVNFDDEIKALILLSSLPLTWDTVVSAISASSGNKKLKFLDVRDLILSEDTRRRESGETSGGAYSSESRGRGRNNNGNSKREISMTRGRGKSKMTGNVICWSCGGKGHLKRECPNPKKKGCSHSDDECSTSSSSSASDEVGNAYLLSIESSIESWALDSGASYHFSPCVELFSNFEKKKLGKVILADGKPLEIMGIGDVTVKTSSGSLWKLQGVRFVPKLNGNLISVSQLDSSGHRIVFGDGAWKVSKGALVVARGTRVSTLYTTAGCTNMIGRAMVCCDSKLGHTELRHMCEQGMDGLALSGKLSSSKSLDMKNCEGGKRKKVSFTIAGDHCENEKLGIVHVDVRGRSPDNSLGSSRYLMTFTEDLKGVEVQIGKSVNSLEFECESEYARVVGGILL